MTEGDITHEKMSAVNGQRLVNLTSKTLHDIRKGEDFKLFFESFKQKAKKLNVEEARSL